MIHRFQQNGYNIIIDPNSGCVHHVDAAAYDVVGMYAEELGHIEVPIRIFQKYPDMSEADVRELLADIDQLIDEGMLFSAPEGDFAASPPVNTLPTKALCLHIAHDCNFRCTYCFAGRGNYGDDERLMSLDVGKASIDWLVRNSGSIRNLDIDFFGGEPLMNFDVVREIVIYARSLEQTHNKRFRFTLTTNGVLIDDEVIDFCTREMENVVLSLDGRREVNDRMRHPLGGGSAYDLILPKFRKMVDARGGKGYYIRGTYTRHNLDFVSDIVHMADAGFAELSMEPAVTAPDCAESWALRSEDLPALLAQYDKLTEVMLERIEQNRDFTFYHYMIDLEGGPCLGKKVMGCGAGVTYLSVTPTGELYPCHRFVGLPEFQLGDVFGGVHRHDITDKFARTNIFTKPECSDCWARFLCSGGCHANFFHTGGDIAAVDEFGCALIKKRIECALVIKAATEEE